MLKNKLVFFYALLCMSIVVATIIFLYKWDKSIQIYNEGEELEKEIEQIKEYFSMLPTKKIKLKITATGEIKETSMNDYLIGVVPSEMSPLSEVEALKAQAIVARTYAYEKMKNNGHSDCDICDNYAHCQAYYDIQNIINIWKNRGYDDSECLEKVKEAVYSTENVVITYNGDLIKAYFHADSGGKTEDVSAIWGKQNIPYLVSVESRGEENHKYYKTTEKFSVAELETKLNANTSKECSIKNITDNLIKIISYTKSGRVDQVDIGGIIYTASELRAALGLKSTNFTVQYSNNEVVFNVTGYGHGVGMSQTGANYYAKNGMNAKEIIQHYYTGVDLAYLNTKD
ncbi:MAG: stage II sporulation protein D [Clostridia bacterium]|nr:stage II sporulation protein D [Clostridia bacterium]